MGGIVSTGNNNDDLIDNLLEVDYIKTSTIERVFRAVDRAEYFLPEGRGNAYKDVAWKCGNLHLSAPCIYSEVMEGLCLEPGLSFLNLGSGTGYLSTMIGLILGKNGVNHGYEVYEDVVQYANKKLEDFKKYSGAIDEYDFCEPKFVTGNCLCLNEARLYDRVYCGASCPVAFEPYMKNLLKIGGILIVPINEHLMQFTRISENTWNSKTLLPVSFASLVQPPDGVHDTVPPIELQPKTLQHLSRTTIRNILRRQVELELPTPPPAPPKNGGVSKKAPRRKRTLKRFIVPLYDDDDDEDDAADDNSDADRRPRILLAGRNGFRAAAANLNNDYDNFFSHVIDTLRFRTGQHGRNNNSVETQTVSQQEKNIEEEDEEEGDAGVAMDVCSEKDDVEVEEEEEEIGDIHNTTASSMLVNCGSDASYDDRRNLSLDPSGSESEATFSRQTQQTKNERKKVDSGLGDENEILQVSEDENDENTSTSDDSEDETTKRSKRTNRHRPNTNSQSRPKWRRIDLEPSFSSSTSDSEMGENSKTQQCYDEMRMFKSRFTAPMKDKIQKLPLPQVLKNYLNFYRDF